MFLTHVLKLFKMRRVCISFSSVFFSQFLISKEGIAAPQSFVGAKDGTEEEKKDWMFAEVLNKGGAVIMESRQLPGAGEFHSPLGWGHAGCDQIEIHSQRGVVKGYLWCVTVIVDRDADSKWKYNVYYCTLSINTYFSSISVHCASQIFRALDSSVMFGQQSYQTLQKTLPSAPLWYYFDPGASVVLYTLTYFSQRPLMEQKT